MKETKSYYLEALSRMIERFNSRLPNNRSLARYYDIDEDDATKDLVLLMEYIKLPNLRSFIESYGVMDVDHVKIITYNLLEIMKDLRKIDWYHGRLNINNIHINPVWNVIVTDYAYMHIISKDTDFTTEEGSRLDIFWLGIWILKMLGKLRVVDNWNVDIYLENLDALKKSYDNNTLHEHAVDFLDSWFERVITIDDLWEHPFIKFDKNGKKFNRKYSTNDTYHQQDANRESQSDREPGDSSVDSGELVKLGLESNHGDSRIGQLINLKESQQAKLSSKFGSVDGSARLEYNPIDGLSKDESHWKQSSSKSNEEFEKNLRAFEMSQLNQKLRKPRGSNFLGTIDNMMLKPNQELSIWKSSQQEMAVINEHEHSTKSNNETKSPIEIK